MLSKQKNQRSRKNVDPKTQQKLLLVLINVAAWIAPFLSARLSYKIWTKTSRYKMPEAESSVFVRAVKQKIYINDKRVMTYKWGDFNAQRPVVLLLHGWNGRGTQLNAFVDALLKANFNVVSFDAYGHGLSDGQHTHVLQSVEIIKFLSQQYGVFFAMIGHSFGALCAVNAIAKGVSCKKLITISAPTEFSALMNRFSIFIGLSRRSSAVLKAYVLRKYGIASFDEISITGLAPRMSIPLLILHDKNDEQVPMSQGEEAARLWGRLCEPELKQEQKQATGRKLEQKPEQKSKQKKNGTDVKLHAKLVITEGLGHVRILRNSQVLERSLCFLLADK